MTKKLKRLIKRIIIGTVATIVAFVASHFVHEHMTICLFVAAYLLLGIDVLKQAGSNILHGHVFDENFLMTLATIGAFVCGEYFEAVAVMLFYQVGEAFQSYAVNKSRKSIKALMDIRPDFARVLRDGNELELDPFEVKVGECILINPGERIPLDGKVIEGTSSLDTSAITGESLPRDVSCGDTVVSGCVNLTGVLKVETAAEFGQSTVLRILELVEEASSKKGKAEQFITVFARVYTPIIVALAALLILIGSLITGDVLTFIYRAMTFLLISCPCALVISIPLSFFGAIGGAGRRGILIKGGNYMDVLSKVDTLVLDKTGTLTKGNFVVNEIETTDYYKEKYGNDAENQLIEYAALAESHTSHPIGLSIVARHNGSIDKSRISEITEIAGKGIKAIIDGVTYHVGNKKLMNEVLLEEERTLLNECSAKESGTLVFLCENGMLSGHVHIVDEIKSNAKEGLTLSRKAGIKNIIMLTGDNKKTAEFVSQKLQLDAFYAELSPLDKVTKLEEILEKEGSGKVAFVGDGINDAPVLSRADLGIAMGAMGSDAAIEASDVVIMTDDLEKIPEAISISKKALRIVKENIFLALFVKILVLILAALGIAHMWAAIFADVGVAALAILNAMRSLFVKDSMQT